MGSGALEVELEKSARQNTATTVKVLVWDLDGTIWDGVLLEDPTVAVFPGVLETLRELDRRGILQSIASRNDFDAAMTKLRELGIDNLFLYPQINWGTKSESVRQIASGLNVGLDSVAFIDDQPFERAEVAHSLPQVLCLDAPDAVTLTGRAEFTPRFLTEDSANRRSMYQSDIRRNQLEQEYQGPKQEFLATLGLEFTLVRAREEDLQRAEELTRRTHQLNTTGYTYDYDELAAFMQSPDHELLIATLRDRFGTYGKIGLCLIERNAEYWTLKLLLMSCRVMSRGVGTVMICHVLNQARKAGVKVRAEFIRTERNRMMYVTYRLGNFQVIDESSDQVLLENDCSAIAEVPAHVSIEIADELFVPARESVDGYQEELAHA
jgi:FkbH-like protein